MCREGPSHVERVAWTLSTPFRLCKPSHITLVFRKRESKSWMTGIVVEAHFTALFCCIPPITCSEMLTKDMRMVFVPQIGTGRPGWRGTARCSAPSSTSCRASIHTSLSSTARRETSSPFPSPLSLCLYLLVPLPLALFLLASLLSLSGLPRLSSVCGR